MHVHVYHKLIVYIWCSSIYTGTECIMVLASKTRCGIVVLMCTEPVYHGYLKYQWYRGSSLMFRQEYPVLYVAREAMYTCEVVGEDFTKYCEFTVKGI